jgi:hypothetical protein
VAKEKHNRGRPPSSTEGPGDEDLRRIVRHLRAALGPEPRQAITRPALRAQVLAEILLEHAIVLYRLDDEPGLGPLLRAQVENALPVSARINAAWRAFFGLTEERHKRLALIEAIQAACEDDRVSGSAAAERAEIARALYASNFPETASQLDGKRLERVVTLWSKKAGRRTGAGSKWDAIADLMADAGIGGGTVTSIRREWTRFAHEVKAAGGISGTQNR